MITFVIYMIILVINTKAEKLDDGNPDIKVNFKNRNEKALEYVVVKDKPLRINLTHCFALFVQCYDEDSKKMFVNETTNGTKHFVINVSKVEDMMSTLWKCVIWQNRRWQVGGDVATYLGQNLTSYNLLFNLHVKGAKPVQLSVNGRNLKFRRTNLSVAEYDGVVYYEYENGEEIYLSCRHPGSPPSSTHRHLTSKDNNSYFDCVNSFSFRNYEPTRVSQVKYIYRIVFIIKTDKSYISSSGSRVSNGRDEGNDLWLMVLSCSFGVVLFINMVCIGFWYTRKKYANSDSVQNSSQNLLNENRGPIPTISNRVGNIYGNPQYTEVTNGQQHWQTHAISDTYSYHEITEYFNANNDGVGASRAALLTPAFNNINLYSDRRRSNIRNSGESSYISNDNAQPNAGRNINRNSYDSTKYETIVQFRKKCNSIGDIEQYAGNSSNCRGKNSDNRDDGMEPECCDNSVNNLRQNCNINQEGENHEHSLCTRVTKAERDSQQNSENIEPVHSGVPGSNGKSKE